MTEVQFTELLGLYNPNGGNKTGKLYDVRDVTNQGAGNLIHDSANWTQGNVTTAGWSLNYEDLVTTSESLPDELKFLKIQAREITIDSTNTTLRYTSDAIGSSQMNGSFWVKPTGSNPAANIRITTNNTSDWNTGTSIKVALTAGWQRIDLDSIISPSTGDIYLMIGSLDVAGTIDSTCYGTIAIAAPQLTLGYGVKPFEVVPYTNMDLVVSGGGGTVLDSSGVYVDTVLNQPKIDYSTDEAVLLMEPTRTNKVQQSNDFGQTEWTKLNTTAIGGEITETTANGYHQVSFTNTLHTGGYVTFSVVVKFLGTRNVMIYPIGTSSRTDWKMGVIFNSSGEFVGYEGTTGPNPLYSIQTLSDGSFRFSVTSFVTSSGDIYSGIRLLSGTTHQYTGSGQAEIVLSKAQREDAYSATTPIDTLENIVTRTRSIATLDMGREYFGNKWIYAELELLDTKAVGQWIFGVACSPAVDGTPRTTFNLQWDETVGEWKFYLRPSNTGTQTVSTGVTSTRVKAALQASIGRIHYLIINGIEITNPVVDANSQTAQPLSALTVGYGYGGGNPTRFSHVRFYDIRILPGTKTNAEIQTLTSS